MLRFHPPARSAAPSGVQASAQTTSAAWHTAVVSPFTASQIRMVLSWPPEAMDSPSGDHARHMMPPLCPEYDEVVSSGRSMNKTPSPPRFIHPSAIDEH